MTGWLGRNWLRCNYDHEYLACGTGIFCEMTKLVYGTENFCPESTYFFFVEMALDRLRQFWIMSHLVSDNLQLPCLAKESLFCSEYFFFFFFFFHMRTRHWLIHKYPHKEFFPVRIFPYSDWIHGNNDKLGKTPCLNTFHTVWYYKPAISSGQLKKPLKNQNIIKFCATSHEVF